MGKEGNNYKSNGYSYQMIVYLAKLVKILVNKVLTSDYSYHMIGINEDFLRAWC